MNNHKRSHVGRFTDVQRKIAKKVEAHGWSVISVFDPDAGTNFMYTVGLELRYEHPELIVLNLPVKLACEFLNGLAQLVAEGRRFRAGDAPPDLPVSPPIRFHRVASRHYAKYLNVCRWLYQGENFRALQIAPAEADRVEQFDIKLLCK